MHRWGMLAVGLCISGWLLTVLYGQAAAQLSEQQEETTPQQLSFPAAVENTQLVIREMAVYEGPFWEDGSGKEAADVCALVVENVGGTMVSGAEITLQTADGTLCFALSWLPPDGVALVPEKSGASVEDVQVLGCDGWNTTMYPEMTGAVTAREQGMGELVFTNHTTQPIGCVEAIYKAYDPESGMYIGGYSVTASIANLQSKEERRVPVAQYASGYSKVVCILLTAQEQ